MYNNNAIGGILLAILTSAVMIADVSYQYRFLTCSQRAPLVSLFCN